MTTRGYQRSQLYAEKMKQKICELVSGEEFHPDNLVRQCGEPIIEGDNLRDKSVLCEVTSMDENIT